MITHGNSSFQNAFNCFFQIEKKKRGNNSKGNYKKMNVILIRLTLKDDFDIGWKGSEPNKS